MYTKVAFARFAGPCKRERVPCLSFRGVHETRGRAGLLSLQLVRNHGGSGGLVSKASQSFLELEDKFGSKNYAPLPVVLARGQGVHVWDVDGSKYLDFLSAYSAVNQGHCHPRLVRAMAEQAQKLTLSSRAFCSDQLGPFAMYITTQLGYDRVLPMNTGAEGTETALKLARRWAHEVKGVPEGQAIVIVARGAFHGRTMAAISTSDDPESYGGYGPLLPGFVKIPFNDLHALQAVLEAHGPNVAAFMVEPIQGEAGIIVPNDGYLAGASELCRKHSVLLVADEVQTGLARTGRMLAVHHEPGVRPDMVILGKALSGGIMPVSAVLADDEVMLTIKPGQHGSTFGGNPLACAVAREALQVIVDEKLSENARERGEQLRGGLRSISERFPSVIGTVRGRGLLNAIVVPDDARDKKGQPFNAWDLCVGLKDARVAHGAPVGLLAKPTHGNIIRLAPPLVITEAQVITALAVIETVAERLVDGHRT